MNCSGVKWFERPCLSSSRKTASSVRPPRHSPCSACRRRRDYPYHQCRIAESLPSYLRRQRHQTAMQRDCGDRLSGGTEDRIRRSTSRRCTQSDNQSRQGDRRHSPGQIQAVPLRHRRHCWAGNQPVSRSRLPSSLQTSHGNVNIRNRQAIRSSAHNACSRTSSSGSSSS